MKSTSSRHHYVHLDGEARADLHWWHCLLNHWNGFMFFRHTTAPAAHVYSDASGSFECGGVILPSQWFQLQWPTAWSAMDITIKKMVPIVIAAALCGGYWHRMHICFHSDNLVVVAILQKRSAKDPITHHLVWCFYFYSAFFQFQYSIEHISGTHNTAADALSRNNLTLFSSLVPQAVKTDIPPAVVELLVTQRPDWGSPRWITLFKDTLPRH